MYTYLTCSRQPLIEDNRADICSSDNCLAVACWTTDHYHPCSNLGVGISEGCFVFDFASLPLEVARPI